MKAIYHFPPTAHLFILCWSITCNHKDLEVYYLKMLITDMIFVKSCISVSFYMVNIY